MCIKGEGMGKKFILMEVIDDSTDGMEIWGKVALWVLVLWWVLLLYYVFKILFYYPIKMFVIGITENHVMKIVISSTILLFYVIAVITSLVKKKIYQNSFRFNDLDNIEIYYGEEFDYFDGFIVVDKQVDVDATISYEGNVDIYKLGDYEVIYKAEYKEKSIIKTIIITVIPYYDNKTYKIRILQHIKVEKTEDGTFLFSGILSNYSEKKYRNLELILLNTSDNSLLVIDFSNQITLGDTNIKAYFESEKSLNTYSYKIDKIVIN